MTVTIFTLWIFLSTINIEQLDIEIIKDIKKFSEFNPYEINLKPEAIAIQERAKANSIAYVYTISRFVFKQLLNEDYNYVPSCSVLLSVVKSDTSLDLLGKIYISVDEIYRKLKDLDADAQFNSLSTIDILENHGFSDMKQLYDKHITNEEKNRFRQRLHIYFKEKHDDTLFYFSRLKANILSCLGLHYHKELIKYILDNINEDSEYANKQIFRRYLYKIFINSPEVANQYIIQTEDINSDYYHSADLKKVINNYQQYLNYKKTGKKFNLIY